MRILLFVALICVANLPVQAQTVTGEPSAVAAEAAIVDNNGTDPQLLEAVVVSGVQPGPGLWRVSKDDHVMWVLGTLTPLPKRMQWVSREVEQVLAESQLVLLGPGAKLKAKIGLFRGLMLLPAALGSRKNPDKQKLVDVVPPELYARWLPLKAKYIGRSRGVEKQRPLFASQKLYEKAIARNRLTTESVVDPVVKKLAKKHKVPIDRPEIEIDIGDPKQAIKDFARDGLDDLDCFAKTLDRLETDLDTMRERANAWATGDIEALRGLPFTDQNQICADAVLNASVSRERGLDDLRQRLSTAWVDAAETAIASNQTTFAVLPMSQILKSDGYIAQLQARGYEVEEP
jgi:uncharacterized protein YbaP (TraB family)